MDILILVIFIFITLVLLTSAKKTSTTPRSRSLYDLLSKQNDIFHEEIYSSICDLLELRNEAGQYRLLDLGCGNARYLAPCLKLSPPTLYEVVDLSDEALAEACKNLAGLTGRITLTPGDLLDIIESTDNAWDVIISGFAVHHLIPEEKARFFRAAGRCLSENGWLILVDVVREESQSREKFLEGYLKFIHENRIIVPTDQLEQAYIYTHPESFSTLREMANAAGLTASHLISRYGQYSTLLFSRSDVLEISNSPCSSTVSK